MAGAMRLGRPAARVLSSSRGFCSSPVFGNIEQIAAVAVPRQAAQQSEQQAQIERKQLDQMFQKAATHGTKVKVKAFEQMLNQAQVQDTSHAFLVQNQLKEFEQMLDQTDAHCAELESELLGQQKLSSKHSEIFAQSLDAATAERAQLCEQVDKLSADLHILTEKMLKEQVGVRNRVQRTDAKGKGGQSRLAFRPTIEDAERQPTHVCELSHQTLARLTLSGNHCAQRERVLREIMAVDGVSWDQAHSVLNKFDEYNERYYWIESFPYRFCIAFTFGVCVTFSLMVFWKPLAHWYGVNVANEELSEGVTDISELTTNQVGTWTWSWMEPMIGVASFALLCAQFSRAQLKKMNMKTYGEQLLKWRADRLARRYPEYDQSMVRAWAKHMPSVNWSFFPSYERSSCFKGPSSGL